jgi:hypothetical protein
MIEKRASVVSLAAALALFLAASATHAQPAERPPENSSEKSKIWLPPSDDLVVNQPSDAVVGRGLLQFLVTHRFRGPVRGSNAHSLYSLDSGADFGFGFTWAPVSRAELSLYRSGIQDDWELAAKIALRPAVSDSLFGAAIRVGGDARRDPVLVSDQGAILPGQGAESAFFAQAILSAHLWRNRVEISAVPSYVSRTPSERRVFNVPVHAAIAVAKSWNVQAEYVPPRAALDGSVAQWTVGIEKVLYRHRFTLVVSNTTRTTVDQLLSGDFALAQKRQLRSFDNGFRNNDWHIGFNLIRQFNIGGL